MSDNVNQPPHYTNHPSGIECIQITEHMGFNLGNALKYIWRCDLKKDAIEDLKKAAWYLEREIVKRESEGEPEVDIVEGSGFITSAPEGATHIDIDGVYCKITGGEWLYYIDRIDGWERNPSKSRIGMRSLSSMDERIQALEHSLNQREDILANAPEGATHLISFTNAPKVYLKRSCDPFWESYKHNTSSWGKFPDSGFNLCGSIRSLDDIRRIFEIEGLL